MDKETLITSALAALLLTGAIGFTILHNEEDAPSALLEATREYVSSGKETLITAKELWANLNDGLTDNDPFMVSLRSASAYRLGHIPGAVNIQWYAVFSQGNLSKLPLDRPIVVYCYRGHLSSQITAFLNVAGYDAYSLKWGMCSWTGEPVIATGCFRRSTIQNDFPTVGGRDPGSFDDVPAGTRDAGCGAGIPPPEAEASGGTSLVDRMNDHLLGNPTQTTSPEPLYYALRDSNPRNDPFVLDIREPELYGAGHVPGAVNIQFRHLFDDDSLSRLPADDRPVVVVSEIEYKAGEAAALLSINGYNATSLKYGMVSWTTDKDIAPGEFTPDVDANDFPVIYGEEPGTLDEAVYP